MIHPNQIKNLKLGQASLYCSKVDRHYAIMNIKKANEFEGRYERKFHNINQNKNVIKTGEQEINEVAMDNLF